MVQDAYSSMYCPFQHFFSAPEYKFSLASIEDLAEWAELSCYVSYIGVATVWASDSGALTLTGSFLVHTHLLCSDQVAPQGYCMI